MIVSLHHIKSPFEETVSDIQSVRILNEKNQTVYRIIATEDGYLRIEAENINSIHIIKADLTRV